MAMPSMALWLCLSGKMHLHVLHALQGRGAAVDLVQHGWVRLAAYPLLLYSTWLNAVSGYNAKYALLAIANLLWQLK